MASNREILEAQRYNRKRLITAFTSGTPGGRELEHRSPMRPLIVGATLTGVLLLVAAVMSRFSPVLPAGWESNTLLVVKGTGARYFSIDGVLRPISNITSARLLSQPGQFHMAEVNADTIAGIPRGSEIGIPEAPDLLPPQDALESTVWAACNTSRGGNHTWVGAQPPGFAPAETGIVTNGKRTWLISGGKRYPVADQRVLFALGLETAAQHPVEATWLNLFPEGSPLAPFTIPQAGEPAGGGSDPLKDFVIGGVLEVGEGTETRRYLVTGAGQLTPLSEVAYRVYRLGKGIAAAEPLPADFASVSSAEVTQSRRLPSDWPARPGKAVNAKHRVCAQLVATDAGPAVALGSVPVPANASANQPSEKPGVSVKGGSGALVRASSGGSVGATSIVTDLGVAFGIGGEHDATLAQLGYQHDAVHVVPAAWMSLVPAGVELSSDAAWATVRGQ